MNRKIRILGIAPYQSLKKTMLSAAADYSNIELEVYVGNLEDGVQLAQQHMQEDFDVILSRGGTAELIRECAMIPVIDIPLSMDDILRSLLLLENMTEDYAIVGYPSVTKPAHMLNEMMHYNLTIITIHHPDELDSVLAKLKKQNCNFILCDVITELSARKAGMRPILITSGLESISSAFETAIDFFACITDVYEKNHLYTDALQMQSTRTIILNENGSVLFSNYDEENIASVIEYLKTIPKVSYNTSSKAFHEIDSMLYSILIKKSSLHGLDCYIFSLEQNPIPIGSGKHGVRYYSYSEVSVMYSNGFYSLTSSARLMEEKISVISQHTFPVMIFGENGCGKNDLAAKIYMESQLKKYPYITIDCRMINDKTWNYIINHYNSPLNDKNNTIFISNLQKLSQEKQRQLLSLFVDTNAYKRNRIILSCSQIPDNEESQLTKDFIDYLTCTTLYMPPLRELSEDIKNVSTLYLNTLNMEMSKQIVGFDSDALAALCSYSWPDNFLQLKRVLTELVMLTSTSYIQYDTVLQVIEKEKQQYVSASDFSAFDYNRPLSEMTREIVKVVLAQCNGNQTLAAKKLEIGRTTLWRYLNET